MGTPVVLKKPITGDIGIIDLGTKSYSIGRIQEIDAQDRYGIVFEGLVTTEGGNPPVL